MIFFLVELLMVWELSIEWSKDSRVYGFHETGIDDPLDKSWIQRNCVPHDELKIVRRWTRKMPSSFHTGPHAGGSC
jgi:hypothetical protein